MKFVLTVHCVDQYINRWRPELSPNQARKELFKIVADLKYIGRNKQNCQVYKSNDERGIRFTVKDVNVITTTLPPYQENIDDEEMLNEYEIEREEIKARLEKIRDENAEKEKIRIEQEELELRKKNSPKIERLREEIAKLKELMAIEDQKRIQLRAKKTEVCADFDKFSHVRSTDENLPLLLEILKKEKEDLAYEDRQIGKNKNDIGNKIQLLESNILGLQKRIVKRKVLNE